MMGSMEILSHTMETTLIFDSATSTAIVLGECSLDDTVVRNNVLFFIGIICVSFTASGECSLDDTVFDLKDLLIRAGIFATLLQISDALSSAPFDSLMILSTEWSLDDAADLKDLLVLTGAVLIVLDSFSGECSLDDTVFDLKDLLIRAGIFASLLQISDLTAEALTSASFDSLMILSIVLGECSLDDTVDRNDVLFFI
jgi:hypothetical protein